MTTTTSADRTTDALCAQVGGDLWFTDPEDAGTGMQMRTAIRICGDCPVQALRRAHADDSDEFGTPSLLNLLEGGTA